MAAVLLVPSGLAAQLDSVLTRPIRVTTSITVPEGGIHSSLPSDELPTSAPRLREELIEALHEIGVPTDSTLEYPVLRVAVNIDRAPAYWVERYSRKFVAHVYDMTAEAILFRSPHDSLLVSRYADCFRREDMRPPEREGNLLLQYLIVDVGRHLNRVDQVVDWALHRDVLEHDTMFRNLARLGESAAPRLRWWIANPGPQRGYMARKPYPRMRDLALRALGAIGGQVSLETVETHLASSTHRAHRRALIEGLDEALDVPERVLVGLEEWLPRETDSYAASQIEALIERLTLLKQRNVPLTGRNARIIGECR